VPTPGRAAGRGLIEKEILRCPWDGYDYRPLDGSCPFGDGVPTFPIDVREDGIYVGVEPIPEHVLTVTDVMADTMVNWGITHVFGMVAHSNLGLADALRRQEQAGRLTYIGIRHQGAAADAAGALVAVLIVVGGLVLAAVTICPVRSRPYISPDVAAVPRRSAQR
jgi:pyruvate oxidase